MSSLNLFPARVAIGKVRLPDGTEVDVMASVEFLRALRDLFARVGGPSAMTNDELEMLAASFGIQSSYQANDDIANAFIASPAQAGQAPPILDPDPWAVIAELRKEVADLSHELLLATAPYAEIGEINKTLMSRAVEQAFAPQLTDWEHPGKLGDQTRNSVKSTTLDANAAVTLNPVNANVTLSPTGTGIVTINPATAGSADNMIIGATTPQAAAVTTLNVVAGGSTTISTGVGSVRMSSANAATNTAWIPIKYAGTTYYVPGWTTNSP